nr:MAG TPA: hypothetical protein [Caudoviricetes sp.]
MQLPLPYSFIKPNQFSYGRKEFNIRARKCN